MTDLAFLLVWATDSVASHTMTPQRADLEAAGWVRVGGDDRYPHMHLMRKDAEPLGTDVPSGQSTEDDEHA